MSINWKRYPLGALLLASFALLLFGCSDYAGTRPAVSAGTKSISGIVSDPQTGLPVSGAKVTAYAIDASGAESTAALSTGTATSDHKGGYTLLIPGGYSGSVMVEADVPASSMLRQLVQLVTASGPRKLKAAVAGNLVGQPAIPPVMVSFATDSAVQYVKQNCAAAGFSTESIRRAQSALESLFGANFSQTPPPASSTDSGTSKAQQDLLVSIQGINAAMASGNANIATIVSSMVSSTGMGPIADSIKSGIAQATTSLTAAGTLPPQYQPSAAINTAISNAKSAPVASADLSDTTAPSAPATLTATAVAAKKVQLSWSASTDDTGVTGYAICRADASGVFATIDTVYTAGSTASSYSYTDLNVAAQSRYSYKVIAFDKGGNLSQGSPAASVTTPVAYDTVAPGKPAGLVCKAVSDGQVNLQWQQSTKTNADGTLTPAASYNIYRNYALIATVSESSFVDKACAAGTAYTYYVKAADADGNLSEASLPLAVKTLAAVSTAPVSPVNLAATSPAPDKVSLSWGASTTPGVTYNVYRYTQLVAKGITGLTYTDAGLTANTGYLYTVTASNAAESAGSNTASVTTLSDATLSLAAPSAPSNLAVVSIASNSVSLIWSASTISSGSVAGYVVFRGDGSGSNFVKIASVRGAGFTDTTVAPASVYSYRVAAFSAAGVVSDSSAIWIAPTPAAIDLSDVTAPSVPAGLSLAGAATGGSVPLQWTASTGTPVGYLVYRNGAQIADVKSGVTFTDSTAAAGSSYSYTVKAYDNAGNLSAATTDLAVTTPAALPNTYTIYGQVLLNDTGLPGVMVTLSSGSVTSSAVTDANGNYSFTGVANGSYTLTPSATSFYLFTPSNRTVAVSGANVSGQQFVAVITGSVTGGVGFPDGTIIGGISYGGSTILGGVTYPTGTVIGGIVYPDGVVIAGVSYPAGTIVGGIAFPVGAITTGFSYPTGTVIGGVIYPTGTVTGGIFYPTGGVSGTIGYPTGGVGGTVGYPIGSIGGSIGYPTGGVGGSVGYPTGSVGGSLIYPTGSVGVGLIYPTGVITGGVMYPTGTVTGGVIYPTGSITGSVSYPTGSITGALSWLP